MGRQTSAGWWKQATFEQSASMSLARWRWRLLHYFKQVVNLSATCFHFESEQFAACFRVPRVCQRQLSFLLKEVVPALRVVTASISASQHACLLYHRPRPLPFDIPACCYSSSARNYTVLSPFFMFSRKTKNKVWTLQITCTVIYVRKLRSL